MIMPSAQLFNPNFLNFKNKRFARQVFKKAVVDIKVRIFPRVRPTSFTDYVVGCYIFTKPFQQVICSTELVFPK